MCIRLCAHSASIAAAKRANQNQVENDRAQRNREKLKHVFHGAPHYAYWTRLSVRLFTGSEKLNDFEELYG
jgi:hypothetical protein